VGELISLAAGFFVVGLVAFGGGQAALPLVERITVAQYGWVSPADFATGVGLAYATPGPVLILATFVGYRVGGIAGAATATVAVFAAPVVLAAGAASLVARLSGAAWFRTFGRYAGAAAVGLLVVTLASLARPVVGVHPALLLAAAAVAAAAWRGVSPLVLLAVAVAGGALIGFVGA
jgi:chromate transporter